MLTITKIKLHNFKRFRELMLDVYPDINILIGDNENQVKVQYYKLLILLLAVVEHELRI